MKMPREVAILSPRAVVGAVKGSSNIFKQWSNGSKGRGGEFARNTPAVNSRPSDAGEFATLCDARVAENLPEDPSGGEFNL